MHHQAPLSAKPHLVHTFYKGGKSVDTALFPCALLDQVSKELDRSATQVSEITLNHALRTALGASAARYDDEDVQDRLRVRKDRSAAGNPWGKRCLFCAETAAATCYLLGSISLEAFYQACCTEAEGAFTCGVGFSASGSDLDCWAVSIPLDDREILHDSTMCACGMAAGGESGWDVFTLQYDVRGPLATIFTRDAMGQVSKQQIGLVS
jgi:hypothetical protein